MATVEQLQELRDLGPEVDENDAALGALIDDRGLNGALAHLWAKRASETAHLVDVTESGSSRKMSLIHAQANNLAGRYQQLADAENPPPTPTLTARTRAIRR